MRLLRKMYTVHDNLGILATLKADGTIEKSVTGSVAEALPLDSADEAAYGRLKEIFAEDSLQMATLRLRRKGIALRMERENCSRTWLMTL